MEEKTIKSYKGFDKDLKCRGFAFEIGKEYEECKAKVCESGFHACEYPLAVFGYYPPGGDSRYCEVEQSGKIDKSEANKTCSSWIKIGAEIKIAGIVDAAVQFIFNKVNWKDAKETNTGDYSAATNTGYYSVATNTGDYSVATNTGDRSAAEVSGKESVGIVIGRCSKARGTMGNWLVLTERGEWNGKTYPMIEVKAFKVDGKTIMENVWYTLRGGEAVEAE